VREMDVATGAGPPNELGGAVDSALARRHPSMRELCAYSAVLQSDSKWEFRVATAARCIVNYGLIVLVIMCCPHNVGPTIAFSPGGATLAASVGRNVRTFHVARVVENAWSSTPYTDNVVEPNETQQIASDDLEQRGKELRAELQQAYQKLVDSRKLGGGRGTDATEAVLPYIPIGTSFWEAETVLRNAGFVVGPRPDVNAPPNPNRAADWYAVIARINPFSTKLLESKISLYVTLLPKSPGDYTIISKISATFFVSFL
jgi:hypothetical protein